MNPRHDRSHLRHSSRYPESGTKARPEPFNQGYHEKWPQHGPNIAPNIDLVGFCLFPKSVIISSRGTTSEMPTQVSDSSLVYSWTPFGTTTVGLVWGTGTSWVHTDPAKMPFCALIDVVTASRLVSLISHHLKKATGEPPFVAAALYHVETGGNCFERRAPSTPVDSRRHFSYCLSPTAIYGTSKPLMGSSILLCRSGGAVGGPVWKPHWSASMLQEPEANAPFS